jgi:hypothetical protein
MALFHGWGSATNVKFLRLSLAFPECLTGLEFKRLPITIPSPWYQDPVIQRWKETLPHEAGGRSIPYTDSFVDVADELWRTGPAPRSYVFFHDAVTSAALSRAITLVVDNILFIVIAGRTTPPRHDPWQAIFIENDETQGQQAEKELSSRACGCGS